MTDGRPLVLLRSSWQTHNIGDVAHSPGAIRAMQRFAPDVEVALWPVSVGDRERRMFADHLPDVELVDGTIVDGVPSDGRLADALDRAAVLVHGSGPSAVAASDVDHWRRRHDKPYGFFGVSFDPLSPTEGTLRELARATAALPPGHLPDDDAARLDGAAFVFCRDSISAGYLRSQLTNTSAEFGPDGTFCFDLAEPSYSERFHDRFGLAARGFLCVVPRARWTPYFRIAGIEPDREMLRREAVSLAHVDEDMDLLVTAMRHWTRTTGLPSVVVPEMGYQVEFARRHLAPRIPADLADHVRFLDEYWQVQQAAAVYATASAVLSLECHSPILAMAAGTPALYLRQPSDTVKGRMYRDLDAGIVEVGSGATGVLDFLDDVAERPQRQRERSIRARDAARGRLREMARTVAETAHRD
ncbi:MAG: polysaccharide pyruvyl transferase family protein [Microbacterium sp.]